MTKTTTMMMRRRYLPLLGIFLLGTCVLDAVQCFAPPRVVTVRPTHDASSASLPPRLSSSWALLSSSSPSVNDLVGASEPGRMQGCTLRPADPEAVVVTEWILDIDGVEADLGRFSQAVYQKLLRDAKQQRFQGFRPGTIPPHLEPTYKAFAMDECARETVLEALQQNGIRPFAEARTELVLQDFRIPPAVPAKKKKKNKKKKKKGAQLSESDKEEKEEDSVEAVPQWRSFSTMKEAIKAGWRPGQSFSFRAVSVKGQRVV